MMDIEEINEFIWLSDLAEINPSKKIAESIGNHGEVSFIPMTDITESGRWINRQTRLYHEVRQGYSCFTEGDVLFAKITPCTENGKGCLATDLKNRIGFGSTEFHILRANEEGDNGFIFQWSIFDSLRQKAAASMIGSAGQQRVPASFFYEYKIPKIPKLEQRKIAEILSTIDRAISQTEAILKKQQRIKTGLMQDLLTKGIDEKGNIRTEETHEFKDSPLGRIPVEWEVEPCSSICKEIVVGIVIRPAQYYKPSGVPILRSANIRENKIELVDLVYMSQKDNKSLSKSCLFEGDLVTVRTGYPGTTAVIPKELDGSNCVDLVISRPESNIIYSNYLAMWINSDFGKKQVLEGQGGLAQQHFNVGEVRKLLVNIPQIKEQERIESFLLKQNTNLIKYQQKLDKLYQLKTALMQDLLTGKVRVTQLITNPLKKD